MVDNSSEHKKKKALNTKVFQKITHNEHQDVLFYNEFMRPSMNRIQIKYHIIGTHEIKKISLSCFDEKYISKTMNTID